LDFVRNAATLVPIRHVEPDAAILKAYARVVTPSECCRSEKLVAAAHATGSGFREKEEFQRPWPGIGDPNFPLYDVRIRTAGGLRITERVSAEELLVGSIPPLRLRAPCKTSVDEPTRVY
jgi:hypothetical protein